MKRISTRILIVSLQKLPPRSSILQAIIGPCIEPSRILGSQLRIGHKVNGLPAGSNKVSGIRPLAGGALDDKNHAAISRPNQFIKSLKEGRITGFLDVVLIPQAGFSDAFFVGVMAEPILRGWVVWGLVVVTEKGDRIFLDITPGALRPGRVLNREPQDPHVSDDLANLAFQGKLAARYVLLSRRSGTPRWKIKSLPFNQRRTDDEPEDRASVIAAACFEQTPVLGQAARKFRA